MGEAVWNFPSFKNLAYPDDSRACILHVSISNCSIPSASCGGVIPSVVAPKSSYLWTRSRVDQLASTLAKPLHIGSKQQI
ncbi:hypothetical protein Y032_0018g3603 [Ancylostoma ceylanicum]|uniref:Uncharacterized protein n=1 Tax=Ancylostoma ceylanicum TaxID=53326 RepID=A0A016V5A7_9BILA|nr:hypothetical protein Y032_0018g3603 [Ancylostoma ceylanicum]